MNCEHSEVIKNMIIAYHEHCPWLLFRLQPPQANARSDRDLRQQPSSVQCVHPEFDGQRYRHSMSAKNFKTHSFSIVKDNKHQKQAN